MSTQRRLWVTAPRFTPLLGVLIGTVGGAVYWLGAQLWPTSVAVVLSMLATAVMPGETHETGLNVHARGFGAAGFLLALLLKYNTLMALSAANLPFAVPANVALGLIMICGHAASGALVVSLIASSAPESPTPVSNGDLAFALGTGFAPAALLGIPGLIGIAVAIFARVAFGAYLKRNRKTIANGAFYAARQLIEVCFYLAALASWPFV